MTVGTICPLVYLSGSICDNPVCMEWRDRVTERLAYTGIDVLNPCRGKVQADLKANGMSCPGKIYDDRFVIRDESDIKRCDALLLLWWGDPGRQSIGTWAELGLARAYQKPIIVVDHTGDILHHPFIKAWATAMMRTEDEALDYLEWLFS